MISEGIIVRNLSTKKPEHKQKLASTLPPTLKRAPEAQETALPMIAPPVQPATVKTPPPKPQP